MRAKYTAKWDVQMAGMNFQTRSRDILRRNDPETDDEEIYLIMEKRAEALMDIFSETAHAYIKNGMRLGAHLLLQLLNLE